MRRGQRLLGLAAVIVLVVGLAVVGTFVVAFAVLPLALVVGLAGLALVVGLGTRVGRTGGRRRARGPSSVRHAGGPADDTAVDPGDETSGRRWVTQWDSGPPASALPFVRGRLAVVMAEWGLEGEAVEPTLLVVTELVSNAVDHARAPVQLVVEFLGESVRVEVHDASQDPPRLQPHDPLRTRGRGLQMVEMLSTTWGWTDTSSGKVVWAEVKIGWPEESSSA